MLNKKDPLIDAIQQVMQSNQADRDAVKAVNEKFGIQDRRVLPRERQGEWDAAYKSVLSEGVEALEEKVHPSKYSPKQKQLAAVGKNVDPDDNAKTIGRADLKAASKGHASHIEEEEKKMKGDDPCWKNYKMVGMKKKGNKPVPNCVPVSEDTIDIQEKAPPGAKYERMVKHIKNKMSKGGLTDKEKSIAYATTWKAKNKSENK